MSFGKWIFSCSRRYLKQAVFGDFIAKRRGAEGEKRIAKIADLACSGTSAVPIKNLYLPWPDGRTCQIDELIIADSGIYVIEMKNYKGWIFGNEKNQYWTQVLSSGYYGQSIKNRLYNPIRQNASHVYCIRKNLKGYKGPIHSLIVFSNEAEFKDITVYSSDVYVLNQSRIHNVFQLIANKHKNCLTADEIQDIKAQLYQVAIPADERRHVENIKMHIADQEDKLEKGICPRCGANLVLRTVKKGNNVGASFIRYAAGKPARLVLQDECGRDPIPKGVGKTPFGEEQHSSGNGNQTAAPRFLSPGSCILSVS